ncbi:hypothetical protein [Ruegeria sp. HKCCD7318]|uniref:hypothetical protein n=1 Tax=Ruegeria sp. HKCCD7318 TaxID=2683014 RepID=UPI0014929CEB|nr:hypothetical protein [Ruegeria sp. HKCCD7318]NOE32503.1 hypothetical protein [Ruegeria sp. HKCCD7318]
MFEPSPHKHLTYAVDRDGQHRLCCAVRSTRTGQIVATAVEADVTYHVPATKDLKAAVTVAMQPYNDRLKHEGIQA